MLRRLIGEHIDLVWKPDADLWPVKMDPAQIDQILANLCVNARDAIADAGKVTIETKNVFLEGDHAADRTGFVPGAYVMLAVSDDGRGMDEVTQAQIFEPFFTTLAWEKGPDWDFPRFTVLSNRTTAISMFTANPGKAPH